MGKLTKVVKFYLICEQTDKQGNKVDHKEIYKILWELQNQVRVIKNKAVQLCWEWNNFSSDYYKINGEYPKEKDILSYTLSGFIYDKLKSDNCLNTGNFSTTLQQVEKDFKSARKDIIKGNRSIINYKSDQPIDLHNKSIKIFEENNNFYARLSILNKPKKDEYNLKDAFFEFKIIVKDNSTKTILERCIDSIYKICASKLIYDKKKKMWCLNLSYQFESQNLYVLDKDIILGVDLGVKMPLCASVYGSLERLSTNGEEIIRFRNKVEARRRSLLRQTKECGDGRIGHGRKTRCKPAYDIEDKIARFRDTKNHIYSRELINFAVQHNCGAIQMEDLTGITKDANKFLKNWSYFDLQTKIENKAKEAGIEVVKIAPQYTSQRCSKCGHIEKDSRQTQEKFQCVECGFSENADYNASQNIAIKDIDKIIKAEKN